MIGAPPAGFKAAYERVARQPSTPGELSDLLALVGYDAPARVIERWPFAWRVQAEVYAVNVHLRASDNIVRRHPRPEWMPEPWRGEPPADADDLLAAACGTPLSATASEGVSP